MYSPLYNLYLSYIVCKPGWMRIFRSEIKNFFICIFKFKIWKLPIVWMKAFTFGLLVTTYIPMIYCTHGHVRITQHENVMNPISYYIDTTQVGRRSCQFFKISSSNGFCFVHTKIMGRLNTYTWYTHTNIFYTVTAESIRPKSYISLTKKTCQTKGIFTLFVSLVYRNR